MAYQTVFKRYELKFLLTKAQKSAVLEAMAPYMSLDKYGRTLICNLYFDTDDYRLIRRSIEKPVYKEKLRIRSYGVASGDSTVFVELKKKYDSVVYKRRLSMSEREALEWLLSNGERPRSQISDEIDYFLSYYKNLHPTVFLSYEREAYYSNDKSDFRVTFDENILGRTSDLSLSSGAYGEPLLDEDKTLMEIKCSGAIPLWMVRILSSERIYKTSFSKYGTMYQNIIFPKQKEHSYV